MDCLTPKTYGLTPRNPSCTTQYLRFWIQKVDGGHLGKWRRVQIAHICDDVITQLLDPHTAMINFRHADNCCYSAASTLLFWDLCSSTIYNHALLPSKHCSTVLQCCSDLTSSLVNAASRRRVRFVKKISFGFRLLKYLAARAE